VGGLVLTSHHTPQADGGTQVTTLAPLYDFNGNVLAYADVATSTITHRMEYDPFGQELSLDTLLPGEGAAEAPRFRFSTKYTDGETGLVYYGYRSYSPELGRWVNRDPIEEKGGINLYGMVGNDAVNRVDVLGLAEKMSTTIKLTMFWEYEVRGNLGFVVGTVQRIQTKDVIVKWICADGEVSAPITAEWADGSPSNTGFSGSLGFVSLSTSSALKIAFVRTDRKTGGAVWDVWYQESDEVGLSFSWGDLGVDGPSRESADVRGNKEVLLTCECVAK
jgi:RHS repeat-associated protein